MPTELAGTIRPARAFYFGAEGLDRMMECLAIGSFADGLEITVFPPWNEMVPQDRLDPRALGLLVAGSFHQCGVGKPGILDRALRLEVRTSDALEIRVGSTGRRVKAAPIRGAEGDPIRIALSVFSRNQLASAIDSTHPGRGLKVLLIRALSALEEGGEEEAWQALAGEDVDVESLLVVRSRLAAGDPLLLDMAGTHSAKSRLPNMKIGTGELDDSEDDGTGHGGPDAPQIPASAGIDLASILDAGPLVIASVGKPQDASATATPQRNGKVHPHHPSQRVAAAAERACLAMAIDENPGFRVEDVRRWPYAGADFLVVDLAAPPVPYGRPSTEVEDWMGKHVVRFLECKGTQDPGPRGVLFTEREFIRADNLRGTGKPYIVHLFQVEHRSGRVLRRWTLPSPDRAVAFETTYILRVQPSPSDSD